MHKRIKVDVSNFDGTLDVDTFLVWETVIEDFFEWYGLTDPASAHFAKIKLMGATRRYLQLVQKDLYRIVVASTTSWVEMELNLREKYVPTHCIRELYSQFLALPLSSLSMKDYVASSNDLRLKCDLHENQDHTIVRFINRLKHEIGKEVSRLSNS